MACNNADSGSLNTLFVQESLSPFAIRYFNANNPNTVGGVVTTGNLAISQLVASNNYVAALSGTGGSTQVDIWTIDDSATATANIPLANISSIALTIENGNDYLYVASDKKVLKVHLIIDGSSITPEFIGEFPQTAGNIINLSVPAGTATPLLLYTSEHHSLKRTTSLTLVLFMLQLNHLRLQQV